MNVLVACEESQAVTIAMRDNGHNAFSCDLQPCSGGHPEWHIMQDVLDILNPGKQLEGLSHHYYGIKPFKTVDGTSHFIPGAWDMIIAFPPCTHLAVSGARHFESKRKDGRQREAIEFFCQFLYADCPQIAIENPIGIISGEYIPKWFPDLAEKYVLPKKPSQIIQPYEYGNHARKTTCLWLKGFPKLCPTNVVDPGKIVGKGFSVGASLDTARDENGKIISWNDPRTAKIRSKTFPGVAKAMADQWAGKIPKEDTP